MTVGCTCVPCNNCCICSEATLHRAGWTWKLKSWIGNWRQQLVWRFVWIFRCTDSIPHNFSGLGMVGTCAFACLRLCSLEAPSPENLSTVFEFILKGFDALGMKDTWIKWREDGEHRKIFTHFGRSEIAEIFVGKNMEQFYAKGPQTPHQNGVWDLWWLAKFHGSFVSRSIRSTSLCKQTILTSTRRTTAWKIQKCALVLECAGIVQRIYHLGIQHPGYWVFSYQLLLLYLLLIEVDRISPKAFSANLRFSSISEAQALVRVNIFKDPLWTVESWTSPKAGVNLKILRSGDSGHVDDVRPKWSLDAFFSETFKTIGKTWNN